MAMLVTAIHAFIFSSRDVNARNKSGHDERKCEERGNGGIRR
jgi:hypothetical protein